MNETDVRQWYVYHRLAEDGLHEFLVGIAPRLPDSDWELWKLPGAPFTYLGAHRMSSQEFNRMNVSENLTDEALELNRMFNKAKLTGALEDHVRIMNEVADADEQLLRLNSHGYSWGDSLKIVKDLVSDDDNDNVIEALCHVLEDKGPELMMEIEDFLCQLVKLDKEI